MFKKGILVTVANMSVRLVLLAKFLNHQFHFTPWSMST